MKKRKTTIGIGMLVMGILLFGTSCVSTGGGGVPSDLYKGRGEDVSLLGAMNGAKIDAVRNAVIDIIGSANEAAHADDLQTALYGTSNPNAYVYKETMVPLRKDKVGDNYVYEIEIRVNIPALKSVLDNRGFSGGEMIVNENASEKSGKQAVENTAPATAAVAVTPGDYDAPSVDDARFIRRYVDTMTYLVYFSESSKTDEFLMKSAIGMANEYLASNSIEAIDLAQVERIKDDQKMVYEAETGQDVSLIQWIAQKLNADVYIEIDAVTNGEKGTNGFYGTASTTLKLFESSSGRLLGSVPYNSPRAFSRDSEYSAIINALQSSIYKSMPGAISQAKAYMEKALSRGIKYELVIQNTPDAKLMSRFRSRLMDKVKDLETSYQSVDETKYVIYFMGRIEDLESSVYDVSDSIPGLEGMQQIMLRGKTLTFNTGI